MFHRTEPSADNGVVPLAQMPNQDFIRLLTRDYGLFCCFMTALVKPTETNFNFSSVLSFRTAFKHNIRAWLRRTSPRIDVSISDELQDSRRLSPTTSNQQLLTTIKSRFGEIDCVISQKNLFSFNREAWEKTILPWAKAHPFLGQAFRYFHLDEAKQYGEWSTQVALYRTLMPYVLSFGSDRRYKWGTMMQQNGSQVFSNDSDIVETILFFVMLHLWIDKPSSQNGQAEEQNLSRMEYLVGQYASLIGSGGNFNYPPNKEDMELVPQEQPRLRLFFGCQTHLFFHLPALEKQDLALMVNILNTQLGSGLAEVFTAQQQENGSITGLMLRGFDYSQERQEWRMTGAFQAFLSRVQHIAAALCQGETIIERFAAFQKQCYAGLIADSKFLQEVRARWRGAEEVAERIPSEALRHEWRSVFQACVEFTLLDGGDIGILVHNQRRFLSALMKIWLSEPTMRELPLIAFFRNKYLMGAPTTPVTSRSYRPPQPSPFEGLEKSFLDHSQMDAYIKATLYSFLAQKEISNFQQPRTTILEALIVHYLGIDTILSAPHCDFHKTFYDILTKSIFLIGMTLANFQKTFYDQCSPPPHIAYCSLIHDSISHYRTALSIEIYHGDVKWQNSHECSPPFPFNEAEITTLANKINEHFGSRIAVCQANFLVLMDLFKLVGGAPVLTCIGRDFLSLCRKRLREFLDDDPFLFFNVQEYDESRFQSHYDIQAQINHFDDEQRYQVLFPKTPEFQALLRPYQDLLCNKINETCLAIHADTTNQELRMLLEFYLSQYDELGTLHGNPEQLCLDRARCLLAEQNTTPDLSIKSPSEEAASSPPHGGLPASAGFFNSAARHPASLTPKPTALKTPLKVNQTP